MMPKLRLTLGEVSNILLAKYHSTSILGNSVSALVNVMRTVI